MFAAAGIDARSCDGRDASLAEEIARQRAGGGRKRPVYNSTWLQLSRGRRPKERGTRKSHASWLPKVSAMISPASKIACLRVQWSISSGLKKYMAPSW